MATGKPSSIAWISIAMMFFLLILASCVWQDSIGEPTHTVSNAAAPSSTAIPLPDLGIEQLNIQAAVPENGICPPDDKIYTLNVRVINHGHVTAGEFTVQINDELQGVTEELAPGEHIDLTFPFQGTRIAGYVDSRAQVVESNETNNRVSKDLSLPELPEACRLTPTPAAQILMPLHTLEGHSRAVLDVTFSPDGRLIASGSVDNTMRLWIADQAAPLRTMQGHSFPVLTLKFTPDGTRLVSGSMDGVLRTWQVSNSTLLTSMQDHGGWITDLDISNDGQLLASASDDFTVRIWRLATSKLLQTIDEGMSAINAIVFSPDSAVVAWAEIDGMVRMRSINAGQLHSLQGAAGPATSIVYSPDGTTLVAGFANGALYVWDAANGTRLQAFATHTSGLTALDFSPNGAWLAGATTDGLIYLWPVTALSQGPANVALPVAESAAWILRGHTDRVNAIDFSPNGDLLVSAGQDGTLQLWVTPADLP